MGIIIAVDTKAVADVNDPSDAWDWLMSVHGLPNELFDKGSGIHPSWEDLPMKFFWNGHKYIITKVENIKRLHDEQVSDGSQRARKEMGKFYPFERDIPSAVEPGEESEGDDEDDGMSTAY
jgi:hypothetical protein